MVETEGDRREQKRFDLQVPALVTFDEKHEKQQFSCITRDISSKGVYLVTEHTLKSGTTIAIQLKIPIYSNGMLPDRMPTITGLHTTGKVVWSSENGMGVCFDCLVRVLF